MLQEESLDIVDLCSPASTHAAAAISALKHDANVVVEKPMAMDYSSAKQVYDAAHGSSRKFTVVQNFRFMTCYTELKKKMAVGEVGFIDFLYSYFGFTNPDLNDQFLPAYRRGILFETGIHDIDSSRDLLGEVAEANATVTKHTLSGQARSINCVLTHKSKALSIIRVSFAAANHSHRLEVNGRKTRASIDFNQGLLDFEREPRTRKEFIHFALKEIPKSATRIKRDLGGFISLQLDRDRSYFPAVAAYEVFFQQFVRSIQEDRTPPVTLEESYANMKILEACRVSSETGQPQKIVDLK